MKDSNYYQIAGWMGNHLHLRGNDLICFAVIYGFSQDGESQFKGKLDYLEECMFASRPTALLSLKKLLECGFIEKEEVKINGRKYCYYSTLVDFDGGKVIYRKPTKEPLVGTDKEPLPTTSKEPLPMTGKEPLPVYKDNNNIDNNINNNNIYTSSKQSLPDGYTKEKAPLKANEDEELFNEFWKRYRKSVDKKKTYTAFMRLSKKDKQAAIAGIEPYREARGQNNKFIKSPLVYIHARTWEDDFGDYNKVTKPYDILPTDSDLERGFKNWMRINYKDLEDVATPLTFQQYMQAVKDCNSVDAVTLALNEISGTKCINKPIVDLVRTKLADMGIL